MSWQAGLSVGTSFAEFTAFPSKHREGAIHKRWYLPKLSLLEGLKNILAENPQIDSLQLTVTSQTAEWVVDRRRGGPIAWLGTSGVENWPMLMAPSMENSATPTRPPVLVASDFMFGVSERVRADGTVEQAIAKEDLEFMVAKLEMAKVKDVAIGFLHSVQNPTNEQFAQSFLQEKGFAVYPSHAHKQCRQEVERWRLALLDAYVAHELVDLKSRLSLWQAEVPQLQSIRLLEGSSPYLSQFEVTRALEKMAPQSLILHLSLEQFMLLETGSTMQEWKTEFCLLEVDLPRFARSNIQPTQTLSTGGWRGPGFTSKQTGYEPGPMVFGKALTPTLIDILSLVYGQTRLTALDGLLNDKAERRILDSLFTEVKGVLDMRDLDAIHVARGLEELALGQLAQDLVNFSDRTQVICTGAFAPLLMPKLQKILPRHRWQLGSEFIESTAVAQLGPHES